jgi:AbrB family looped-hinge helix DNA binding protein
LSYQRKEEGKSEFMAKELPAEVSKVYERGQTVIPKRIREALAIESGAHLQWQVHEGVIQVVPIPREPVRASIGLLKGKGLTFSRFLRDRQKERRREREREAREQKRWPTSSTRRPS